MPFFSRKLKRVDEISPKNWVHTLDLTQHSYYKAIAKKVTSLLAIILIVGVLLYATNSRGQIALLYPSTCLGSWANASLAQGEPTLEQGNSPLVFSDENAAIASGRGGELFCGGFVGSLPENVKLKHTALKVVWSYTEPRHTESDGFGQIVERTIEIPQQASSTPLLIEDILNDEAASSTALLSRFFAVAHAQEIPLDSATSTPQEEKEIFPVVQEPQEEIPVQVAPEVIIVESVENIQEESIHETSTVQEVIEDAVASSTQETVVEDVELSQDDLVLVRYSLDGEAWEDLGMLRAGYPLASFELPLENLEDIAKLQVGFTSLANPKEQVVFIEGMILEVEHSDEPEAPKLRQRLPALQHRDFSLDLEAAHNCSIEPFTIIIRENETKEAVVSARIIPQEHYVLEIANLPDYIDGTFAASGKQFVEMDGIGQAAFTLTAKPNAQKGSFSLTMLVKRPGETIDDQPMAFCQFNVISE